MNSEYLNAIVRNEEELLESFSNMKSSILVTPESLFNPKITKQLTPTGLPLDAKDLKDLYIWIDSMEFNNCPEFIIKVFKPVRFDEIWKQIGESILISYMIDEKGNTSIELTPQVEFGQHGIAKKRELKNFKY